jgi:hydroxybutyrate-dimer hydrolase
MKKCIFTKKSSTMTWGILLTLGFALLIPAALSHANQSPALAYGHYIGHFGAKNVKPPYIGEISAKYYDGDSDDLLTAGLGKTGLGGAAPLFVDPLNPSPAELRRNAIYTNYRAVLDISPNGGYGTLYGPNLTNDGNDLLGEGKIPGWEYIAYSDDGSGR